VSRTQARPAYYETEAGLIPINWRRLQVRDVCRLINGRGFKPHEWSDRGLPIIRIQNLNGSSQFNYFQGRFDPKILVKNGQLLFAWSGSRGTSFGPHIWLGPDAVLNYHTWKVAPNELMANDFLFYALSDLTTLIEGNAHGASALVHMQKWEMESFYLVVPPRAEQSRIAAALQDVDDLVTTLKRSIAKKQAIKQGMMQQLLTGMTRLAGYDSPWADVRLGDHVTYVKTVALSRAQLDATSSLRYLHYGDIHTSSEVRLAAGERPMPRVAQALAKSAGRLQIGDLVFADASEDPDGVGKSVEIISVPPAGVVPGLHTIAARFDKSVLADGFKAYLQFIPTFREALLRLAAGTKVLATTRSYISSISLTLPNVDEQRAIAAALVDCDEEIAAFRDRLRKANAVKQGMMQELLTGRTRLSAVETMP
jgi:type I restriction enzyme S subunit